MPYNKKYGEVEIKKASESIRGGVFCLELQRGQVV